MPNLGYFHPLLVHFVVGVLYIAVAFRIVSFTGRLSWTNYAATTLLLIGAAATVLAVQSGTDAHGPVERIPGTRELVQEHERQGTRRATTSSRLPRSSSSRSAWRYVALGEPDSARAVLASAVAAFPQNTRLKAKLDSIK